MESEKISPSVCNHAKLREKKLFSLILQTFRVRVDFKQFFLFNCRNFFFSEFLQLQKNYKSILYFLFFFFRMASLVGGANPASGGGAPGGGGLSDLLQA